VNSSLRRAPCVLASLGIAALAACTDARAEPHVRGRGLDEAQLAPAEQARVYRAALGQAFDLGPALTLMLEPRQLPRTRGYQGGEAVDDALRRAILAEGTVQGVCTPVRRDARHAPRCAAGRPGYVVRFSDVFRMPGDSVQVHVTGERFDTPTSGPHGAFRFEGVYQIVRRDGRWRVVREGRVKGS
jgi:hypothetical protein